VDRKKPRPLKPSVSHGVTAVDKTDYKPLFDAFRHEIKNNNNPSFVDVDSWTMADDLPNGVLLPYTIKDRSARELLHRVGRKYGLIPLCPDEVVDIDVSGGNKIMRSFVRTLFGEMDISSKSG